MKNNIFPIAFLLAFAATMQSCSVIGDILEVGIWLGIIIVVIVVAIVFWILKKIRG
jgi:hypothetical protein